MPPTAADPKSIGSGRGNLLAFAGAVACSQKMNKAVKTEMHACMAGWLAVYEENRCELHRSGEGEGRSRFIVCVGAYSSSNRTHIPIPPVYHRTKPHNIPETSYKLRWDVGYIYGRCMSTYFSVHWVFFVFHTFFLARSVLNEECMYTFDIFLLLYVHLQEISRLPVKFIASLASLVSPPLRIHTPLPPLL